MLFKAVAAFTIGGLMTHGLVRAGIRFGAYLFLPTGIGLMGLQAGPAPIILIGRALAPAGVFGVWGLGVGIVVAETAIVGAEITVLSTIGLTRIAATAVV